MLPKLRLCKERTLAKIYESRQGVTAISIVGNGFFLDLD
jgi:hypothetical protein